MSSYLSINNGGPQEEFPSLNPTPINIPTTEKIAIHGIFGFHDTKVKRGKKKIQKNIIDAASVYPRFAKASPTFL